MDLTEFAEGGKRGPQEKKAWTLAPLDIKFEGFVLAFDQSFSKLPWVFIQFRGGLVLPKQTGMFEPDPTPGEKKGSPHDILTRCDRIFEEARLAMRTHVPTLVVHESPLQGRARFLKPEMSFTPAMAVRCAAKVEGIPIKMIHTQKAKVRFTGNQSADKKDVHAPLLLLVPFLAELKPNNADTRDAAALAVVAAEEG